ncbi:hypothetical protein TNCV_4891751 [Trichonephila clavipes]|nr:hypothetical protein TNCV_4891751 [Trichonephila clavipes]
MIGLLPISVLLYVIGWIEYVGLVLCSPRSPDLTQLDLFPMGQSLGIGVSRHSDYTNIVARLFAACTSVDTTMQRCGHSSIPQCAQACRDMHGGHFKRFRL